MFMTCRTYRKLLDGLVADMEARVLEMQMERDASKKASEEAVEESVVLDDIMSDGSVSGSVGVSGKPSGDGDDKEGDDASYNTLIDVGQRDRGDNSVRKIAEEQEEHHANDVEQDKQPRRSQRIRVPKVSSPWVFTKYGRKKSRKA